MRLNLKNLSITIPILFGGIALFLHGYLGYFSRYIADDFCSAYQAGRLGIFRAAWFWYLTWSGRFSASVLDSIIGLLGPGAVPFLVPLTIIIWLAVLTVFFLIFIFPRKNGFLAALALATTILFALFLLAPDIRQSLYWGQGMRSVIPPLILGTIQLILLSHLRSRPWTSFQLGIWSILSFGWALVVGGFSETYASFQVAAFLFSLIVVVIAEKFRFTNTSLFLTSGLLGAVSAVIIIILAPGNSARQTFYPAPPGILGILTISLKSFPIYLIQLVNSPEKILAILGLFSLAAILGAQIQRDLDSRLLVVIPILIFVFMFTCFPPSAYGISDAPPDRTLILPTYFFLLGLIAWGAVVGNLLGKNQTIVVSKILPIIVIAAITLAASIHSMSLYQSRHEFTDYAAFWDKTHTDILKSKQKGETQILIPATPNWAHLNIPNDNPKYWVNLCISSYYDLQVLTMPNSSSE